MIAKVIKGIAPTRTIWVAPRTPATAPRVVKPAVAP